jgi:diguanylate cyclase (GGDEF)-like protein/PAS domain S-box-containing protein
MTKGLKSAFSFRALWQAIWLPLLINIVLDLAVYGAWLLLTAQEEANIRQEMRIEAEFIINSLDSDLRGRVAALQRMARSWELHDRMTEEEFASDARSYMFDVLGFQALEWVDRNSVVRRVVPLEGNEARLGRSLDKPPYRALLEEARDLGHPVVTPLADLVSGGRGFMAFFPIRLRGEYDGCVLAETRAQEWIAYVLSQGWRRSSAPGYLVSVELNGESAFTQAGWEGLSARFEASSSSVTLLGHAVTAKLRPTRAFVKKELSSIPALLSSFGILMTFLSSLIVFFYQGARRAAGRAGLAARALEVEALERTRMEGELERSLLRVDLATRAGKMGIWTWDLATDRLEWNQNMYELMDIPPDVKPSYATWRDVLVKEDVEATEAMLRNAVSGRAVFDTEFRIQRSSGEVRHIRAAARVIRDDAGQPVSVTGINWDITEHRRTEEALRRKEDQVRLILDSAGEAIYGIGLDGICTFANAACARILKYPDAQSLIGKNMHNLIHYAYPDGHPMDVRDCRIFKAFMDGKPEHADDEVLWRADGTGFPAEYWSYPKFEHGLVQGAVVTFIDISERKKSEETIRHMATHDGLTDLPSLRLVKDRLAMAMNRARRNKGMAAVMFVDLDGFKSVNDGFGHDAGDAVLKEVARRLSAAVREIDTVGRCGGDEFIVILTDLQSRDNAASVAEKIVRSLAEPIAHKGQRMSVGASVGIAIYPDDGRDAEDLIKASDDAMYRVKNSSKNAYQFADAR